MGSCITNDGSEVVGGAEYPLHGGKVLKANSLNDSRMVSILARIVVRVPVERINTYPAGRLLELRCQPGRGNGDGKLTPDVIADEKAGSECIQGAIDNG